MGRNSPSPVDSAYDAFTNKFKVVDVPEFDVHVPTILPALTNAIYLDFGQLNHWFIDDPEHSYQLDVHDVQTLLS